MIDPEALRPDDDMEAGLAANTLRATLDFGRVPENRNIHGPTERTPLPDFSKMTPNEAGEELARLLRGDIIPYNTAVKIADDLGLLQNH